MRPASTIGQQPARVSPTGPHGPEGATPILPVTHRASLVIFCILVPAVVLLWGAPDRTADTWAWTIQPEASAVFLGSGYGAGAFFFLRTFRARAWPPSSAGVLGASVFAGLMLVVTLVHWDRFNHGDAPAVATLAFYGWVGVYIVSPFAVLGIWWVNQRLDGRRAEPGAVLVGDRVRLAAGVFGGSAVVAAAVILLSPQTMIDVWGWELTPLTARILGCFTAQVGVGALWLSTERRWSAWKLIVETFVVATALLLVGAIRVWDDFDTGRAMTWLYLGGLLAGDAALILLYRSMTGLGRSRDGAL